MEALLESRTSLQGTELIILSTILSPLCSASHWLPVLPLQIIIINITVCIKYIHTYIHTKKHRHDGYVNLFYFIFLSFFENVLV